MGVEPTATRLQIASSATELLQQTALCSCPHSAAFRHQAMAPSQLLATKLGSERSTSDVTASGG